MARPPSIIARGLAIMAMAAIAAIALGFATTEPAGEHDFRLNHHHPTIDPLWPDHLRCLVLGAEAVDDPICTVLLASEREG